MDLRSMRPEHRSPRHWGRCPDVSDVARSFPPPFRARLAHCATSATTDDGDTEMRRAYRAAADQLLDAADIVVSTTILRRLGAW